MKHSVRRLCQCLLLFLLPLLLSCGSEKKRYVVGVSQCSEDVWREKLNEELRIAALYYNDVDLRISSANDDVQMQTEQINKFVDEGVDLLIVAPGQVSISPAIDRAYEKGIPVIIFDRRTRSDKYTAYIGADNKEIGSSMGGILGWHTHRRRTHTGAKRTLYVVAGDRAQQWLRQRGAVSSRHQYRGASQCRLDRAGCVPHGRFAAI